MITQKELKKLLHYDPDLGQFTWLKRASSRALPGRIAGGGHNGSISIRIKYRAYEASKLAWLYEYGHYPLKNVKYKNNNKKDLRILNLSLDQKIGRVEPKAEKKSIFLNEYLTNKLQQTGVKICIKCKRLKYVRLYFNENENVCKECLNGNKQNIQ